MAAGYSTTPLADELGFKPGMRVFIADMPERVRARVALDALGLELLAGPGAGIDAAHIFVADRATLERELGALRQLIAPGGFIWVSWSSQAGEATADVTAATVCEVAAPLALVEVKRCSVDPAWAGLKLMIG